MEPINIIEAAGEEETWKSIYAEHRGLVTELLHALNWHVDDKAQLQQLADFLSAIIKAFGAKVR
jgi:hypothetical protein